MISLLSTQKKQNADVTVKRYTSHDHFLQSEYVVMCTIFRSVCAYVYSFAINKGFLIYHKHFEKTSSFWRDK